jgi:hypothetical protein
VPRDAKGALPMIDISELIIQGGHAEVNPAKFAHNLKESED